MGGSAVDLSTLRQTLETERYIFEEGLLTTLYISVRLGKPLLIEGAAGVGKTEVAKILAKAYGTELIRLQCYGGLDEAKVLYEWNYQKQLLSIQLEEKKLQDLFSREFLLERPLLKAISSDRTEVLLIDEIDKADEEFEAFLLELLSDFQVSIPELGTIKARKNPMVLLTSNNSRQISDALRRRCTYMFIDYPTVEKECAIINAKIPGIPEKLARDVAAAVAGLRGCGEIFKKPSIAETLDWASALMAIDVKKLDKDSADKTLGFVLKNQEDILEFKGSGGFGRFLAE